MSKAPHLAAVPDDHAKPPADPVKNRSRSLSAAADSGEREQLLALRDRLASIIDQPDTLARDVASLSIRYMKVVAGISALDAAAAAMEGDALGDAADSPDEGFDPSAV